MASKYRRVKWSVEVDPDFVFHEGWFHEWSTQWEELNGGLGQYPSAIVEDDNGDVHVKWAGEIKFITPPNVDMDTVCGDCGRVMGYVSPEQPNETCVPGEPRIFHSGYYECQNPTCPGKEAQNENG